MHDYSVLAAAYDQSRERHEDVVTLLRRELRVEKQRVHVDLACGTCIETAPLAPLFGAFIGVDSCLEMLSISRIKVSEAHFICADISKPLPFQNAAFDSASIIAAIHHVSDPLLFSKEASRILCSRGRLVIITNSIEQIRKRDVYSYFPGVLENNMRRFMNVEVILRELPLQGFSEVKTTQIPRPLCNFDWERLHRLKTKALDSAFQNTSCDDWNTGIQRLEHDLKEGRIIRHCRDRLLISASLI